MKSIVLKVTLTSLFLLFICVPSGLVDTDWGNVDNTGDVTADGGFYVPIPFSSDDIVADANTSLFRSIPHTSTEYARNYSVRHYKAPFSGSVLAISVSGSGTLTDGSTTYEVMINNVATGLTASWSCAETSGEGYSTQAKDLDTFSAGDLISVKITTDSTMTPESSGDVAVDVLVEMGDQTTR